MNHELKLTLIHLARGAIATELGIDYPPANRIDTSADWLQQPAATFVTLNINGRLRGCIGSLQARRSLFEDIRENARAAAFSDPRFAPLSVSEFEQIDIEISLLSEPAPLQFEDEADALAQLRPGSDGVIFEYGPYRSTFLPQVWEQLPDAKSFITRLKLKAGLSDDFWHQNVRLQTYRVEKFSEAELMQTT